MRCWLANLILSLDPCSCIGTGTCLASYCDVDGVKLLGYVTGSAVGDGEGSAELDCPVAMGLVDAGGPVMGGDVTITSGTPGVGVVGGLRFLRRIVRALVPGILNRRLGTGQNSLASLARVGVLFGDRRFHWSVSSIFRIYERNWTFKLLVSS